MSYLNRHSVFKCNICGNVTILEHDGGGQMVCCGVRMHKLVAQYVDSEGNEKHVPVLSKGDNGAVTVRVGENLHPMLEEHKIEWVELRVGAASFFKYFKVGDVPEHTFCIRGLAENGGSIIARAYCNIHGLWKGMETN